MILTSVLVVAALGFGIFAGVIIQKHRQSRTYSDRSRRAAKTRAEYVARRAAIERAHEALSARLAISGAGTDASAPPVVDRGE